MDSKICEICKNKSRYHDFLEEGKVTCACEASKKFHDECLFNKIDSSKEYYYFKIIALTCETCNSKLLLNGTFYTYHRVNGLCSSKRNYKDSVLNGIYKEYCYDGETVIKEMNYKDGNLHGLYKSWTRNKHLDLYLEVEENYNDGKLEGLSIIYDDEGYIVEKIIYKDGVAIQKIYDD
jgi:antitoxin component YwqK of YwqJK toxin-antitoxin module